MKLHWTVGTALAVALSAAGLSMPAQAAWTEDFTGVTDATEVGDLFGWSGSGSASVDGEQISAVAGSQFTRTLSPSEVVVTTSGPASFSMTWRDTHPTFDPFHSTDLLLGEAGGTNAFIIRIRGNSDDDSSGQGPGAWDNTRDNSIHLSSGGPDVGSATFTDYVPGASSYNSPWIRMVTYTLEITNIDLAAGTATVDMHTDQTWTGSSASGTHSIDAQPIVATGGGFSEINYFSFVRGAGHAGSVHTFDNFALTAVPEPASLALLSLGGVLLLGRRRCGRRQRI